MFIRKQKEQILKTIHDAEVLAGQIKAANEEIGERQNVANDQDEAIAVVYEELLSAEEMISEQAKTIKSLKTTANAAKKAADEAVRKVEELLSKISETSPDEEVTDDTPVTEVETPAENDKEVTDNE